MLAIHIISWFTFGFAVAGILLYGPTIAKACRIKTQAIAMMKEATQTLRESAAKEKGFAKLAKEKCEVNDKYGETLKEIIELGKRYGSLQNEYIALSGELREVGNKLLEERKDFIELAKKYEELQKDHKALLWRSGGGVEGTV